MTTGAAPNLAGTMESQSIVTIPAALSLKAKVQTLRATKRGRRIVRNSVLLSGKLLENLKGVAGAKVAIFASGRSAGSATTAGSGAFSKTLKLPKRTSGTAGCVAATMAAYKIGSAAVSARPRKR